MAEEGYNTPRRAANDMSMVSESPGMQQPWLQAVGSRQFLSWLHDSQCSLAFSTYQSGKLFLIGRKSLSGAPQPTSLADSAISVFERTFTHCMGLWASEDAKSLWLSSRFQIWRFQQASANAFAHTPSSGDASIDEPAPIPDWSRKGYDFAYIPRVGYTTGHIDVHDLAVDGNDRPIFVNTIFNCLATVSETSSFKVLWKPPFISEIVPEDRCHLNGLAMKDGKPYYASVVGRSNVRNGWRERRLDGGEILEIASGETVCYGLSMPHAPRCYRDRLWVLNSGSGEFGFVDLSHGRFVPVCFCPGYMRGLSFCGRFAIVTLSKPRYDTFQGLELDTRLEKHTAEAECGLQIIDLDSGNIHASLRLDGTLVTELYDTVVLKGVRQPMAVGFKNDEIERYIVMDDQDLTL